MNSTTNTRRRPLSPAARATIFVVCALLLLALTTLLLTGGQSRSDRDREDDSVRLTSAGGDDVLVTLVEIERVGLTVAGRNRRGVGLELMAHDPASAQPLWSQSLVWWHRAPVGANRLGYLLGHDGRQLWLMAPRLQTFDLRTREKHDAIAALEQANPELEGLLTDLWKHLDFDDKRRQLAFIAADGREYRVEPQTLRAVPFDPETAAMPKLPADPSNMDRDGEESFDTRMDDYIAQVVGRAEALVRDPGDYWYRGLRIDERHWLGLFTRDEARSEAPGNGWSPLMQVHGDTARRRLHLVTLEEQVWNERLPDDTRTVIASNEPLQGDTQVWLQGGMLREADAKRVLRLRDPDGVLVLHRDRIDSLGTVRVTRIGFDGKPLWTADTGLGELTQVFPGDEYVLFTGLPPMTPQEAQRRFLVDEQLVSVATADGAVARDEVLVAD